MKLDVITEIREAQGQPSVYGVILQEGRAATQRLELFAPGSVMWPQTGIDIKDGHGGRSIANAVPRRQPDGRISVIIPATQPVREARAQSPYLSVEFIALQEHRQRSGVREITEAFVRAAAFVSAPEYQQATTEMRSRAKRLRWL
ncbi:hypothetical protein F4X90_06490 [Candidatus Poribacteria bacterium]|nr:hypothetical protein [Candidatus Poribacteria bacterium]